ncbi:ABC transporter substrate-binding protein [Paenibacillus chungangensis]|uniref:ABC transporter substrate-binding protein n=1 Tax=Paenibacillus chungangensis TaxID=696535 RepID=A0ABW3HR01_9BACL
MKKGFILLLSVIMLLSLLAACGKGNNNGNGNGNGSTQNESTGEGSTSTGADVEEKPLVTLTTARPVGSDVIFINGEDITNNVHNKWAKEKLGIDIKDIWTTADNVAYHTKLRLALSTNVELPDVFIVQDRPLVADLIASGKVLEIKDLFEQHAPDRIKALYTEFDSALNQLRKDGGLYGLPIFTAGDGTNPVLWVRQDWLDKLGLEAPKTIADFEKVMDAFTNLDPDGNNKKDTIGFAFSARENFSNWMSDASFIFGAYTGNAIPGAWAVIDGQLKHGSVLPEMKQGLGKLKEWASKGYLDPETPILDPIKATESFIQGRAGMIAAPYWAEGWPLNELYGLNPDAKIGVYALPTGDDGKSARFMNTLNENKVMLFNKDFKHFDRFMEYFDRIYDAVYETGDFQYGFFEGYDYALVDGKPVFDSKQFPTPIEKGTTPGKYNLFWNTPQIPLQGSAMNYRLNNGETPKTTAESKAAAQNEITIRAGALNYEMRDTNTPDQFLGAPTETMRSKGPNLDKMLLETYAKIIFTKEPLDTFDTLVQDWYDKGGKQIEEEVNAWYKSVQ